MRAPTQPRVRAGQKRAEEEPAPAAGTSRTGRSRRKTRRAPGAPAPRAGAAKAAGSRAGGASTGKDSSTGSGKATASSSGKAAKTPTSTAGTRGSTKGSGTRTAVSAAPRVRELTAPVRDRPRVTAQFAERLAERRAAVRRLRWRSLALIAAGVLLLVGLGYVVLFSSLLALRGGEIEVTGTNQIVSEEEVLAVVTAAEGTPLARVDTAGLAGDLTTIVGVREAHLERNWPHGLQVVIEPRVPVAVVQDGEAYAVLDGDGVELSRSDEPAEDLPVVDVPLGEEDTAAALTAVLEVLDALPEDLLADVAQASAPSPNRVSFELPDGIEVFWGSSAENALKVEVLQTLRQVEATGYDVSAPRAPITIGEPEQEQE
ncbi:MAG TPA: FtsQ-type POTRA domain-containing protein [Candidatus Ruania gallistercoris]|uniref:FtsQ-type POTRA domain-containing protein n=1 Tax=Candidatus Ruania gallistercoris TaxID=2838746 RepID=A0A9D2J5A7_9MICO|nr:FtsQ-type POTRA domain-containing protein [Candidatus Ruania gallistercoris]